MKKLFIAISLIMLFFVNAYAFQKNNLHPELRSVHNGIVRQIKLEVKKFISENDLSQDYSDEYYKPLMEDIKEIIYNYNVNKIVQSYNKIVRADIFFFGLKDKNGRILSKKPQGVAVVIIFITGDEYTIVIPIEKNLFNEKGILS